MSLLDKKSLKLAIIKAVKNTTHGKAHKINVLGRPYESGALEYVLGRKLSDDERAQARLAWDELVTADRLRPTMDDLVNPQLWVRITQNGEEAFQSERFKEDERFVDTKTGLPLGEQFEEDLQFEINSGHRFSMAFIDMDNLKSLNDLFGHDSADRIISEFAVTLRDHLPAAKVYRRASTGDEFLALFCEVLKADSGKMLESALENIRSHQFLISTTLQITFSAGVSSTEDSFDAEVLKKRANDAMYISKHSGKNRVTSS